jgi:putative membrane protein
MENPTLSIKAATFNPKVKTYIFLVVLWFLLISIIGWLILPFWLFGLGQWLSNKFYHTLKCELTNKNLKFSKGVIFHVEKTIPLENIQDISFIGGPVLRSFGLTIVKVETAGGGGAHHSNQMSMIGMDDSENFKQMILEAREKMVREKNRIVTVGGSGEAGGAQEKLLADIRAELSEIKTILREKNK